MEGAKLDTNGRVWEGVSPSLGLGCGDLFGNFGTESGVCAFLSLN